MKTNLLDMTDKVAIITGGASGMGQAAVLTFLDQGAHVVIGDLNDANAEETLALAQGKGFDNSRVHYCRTNVAEEADIKALVTAAVERFGRLDCMFNNAGMGGALGPLTETRVEDWDRTIAVLLRGVFLGIKHAARAIRLHGQGGSIINTTSTGGRGGGAGPTAYSAAKAAVENVTRNAAVELAPDLIRVNAIAPGFIKTPLNKIESDEQFRETIRPIQPLPVIGMPQDIANTALFLASDASRFITGTSILVDGGKLAWGPRVFPLNGLESAGYDSGSTDEQDR